MHDRTGFVPPVPMTPVSRVTFLDLCALEWRRLSRDTVFWVVVGLSCLALWYGLANGAAWMRLQEQAIAQAHAIASEHIAEAKS